MFYNIIINGYTYSRYYGPTEIEALNRLARGLGYTDWSEAAQDFAPPHYQVITEALLP